MTKMGIKSSAEDAAEGAKQHAEQGAAKAADVARRTKIFERIARAGYLTKGIIYAVVSWLAIDLVFGISGGGKIEGSRGALDTIAQQPFGKIMIGVLAIGLVGYSLWRFVQAFLDPDEYGSDKKGLLQRFVKFLSGAVYTGLAYSVFQLLMSDKSVDGDSQTKQVMARKILELPGGKFLLGGLGLLVVGFAISRIYSAYKKSFLKQLATEEMSAKTKTWVTRIGQIGTSARGIIFGIIGGFIINGALQSKPSDVNGVQDTLKELAKQPYGNILLGIAAFGLLAYSLHCAVMARYRHIPANAS